MRSDSQRAKIIKILHEVNFTSAPLFVHLYFTQDNCIVKRIKLDIGTLTSPARPDGNYTFLLYKKDSERCISINLTPAQTNAILTNMQPSLEPDIPIQSVCSSIMVKCNMELTEVQIIKGKKEGIFRSRLFISNGQKELYQDAGVIDGVIMARHLSAPIYIEESLIDKYSVALGSVMPPLPGNTDSAIEKLQGELEKAIENEEYERASSLNSRIKKLKKDNRKSSQNE